LFADRADARGLPLSLSLRDGRTGATLAALPPSTGADAVIGDFLHDDRVVVLDRASRVLHVYSARAELQADVADVDCIGGQPAPERLFLCRGNGTVLVDTTTGRVLREEPDLRPIAGVSEPGSDPMARVHMGEEGTRLFLRGDQLVRLDPDTGARQAIIPR
jgi:hypothetical protein